MSNNPFATTAPANQVAPAANQAAPVANQAAPQAAPANQVAPTVIPTTPQTGVQAAPVAPQAGTQVAPTAPKAAVPAAPVDGKKPRKKPNRQMTLDERKYVIENYHCRSTSDMARELGLTRQQVYRTVHEARGKIKDRIEAATAGGNPAMATKLQAYMAEKLPEKPFGGGAGGASKGSSVDTVLDDLLAGV